jgi:hypothetical protein
VKKCAGGAGVGFEADVVVFLGKRRGGHCRGTMGF